MNTAVKSNLSVHKKRAPSLDEQLRAAVRAKNYPHVVVPCNERGEIIIDKDKDPDLYDFAVNG